MNKKVKNSLTIMRLSVLIVLSIIISFVNGFSQTEFDHYEKQRLERKEKKVKTISQHTTFNNFLESKDYFNTEGYLVKREIYDEHIFNEDTYEYANFVTKEILILNYDNKGGVSGREFIYEKGNKVSESNFNKLRFALLDRGYREVKDITHTFDNSGRLTESKYLYSDDERVFFKKYFYDNNNKLLKSIFYNNVEDINSPGASITIYSYNELGLLENEATSYRFQNGGRDYGNSYIYEFY